MDVLTYEIEGLKKVVGELMGNHTGKDSHRVMMFTSNQTKGSSMKIIQPID